MQQSQLLPLPQDLPTFDEASSTLNDMFPMIYKGLENGAYKVAAYRDQEFPADTLDAGLAASILRCHSSRLIRTIGTEFEFEDWVEDRIPFMGMSYLYKGYHVRIRKGPNGELPGCGDSSKMRRFYNQLPTKFLIGNERADSKCNVIVLWNFGPGYTLEQLRLALPAIGAPRAENVSFYWNQFIPYPAEGFGGPPRGPEPIPGSDDGGLDKLIQKPEAAKEDTGKTNVR
jgi:hypothetical protein